MEDEQPEEELQRGRDVLEQAEHRHRDAIRRTREQQQRNGGQDPRKDEQHGVADATTPEGAASLDIECDKVREGDRSEDEGFQAEALERADTDLLLDQTV